MGPNVSTLGVLEATNNQSLFWPLFRVSDILNARVLKLSGKAAKEKVILDLTNLGSNANFQAMISGLA